MTDNFKVRWLAAARDAALGRLLNEYHAPEPDEMNVFFATVEFEDCQADYEDEADRLAEMLLNPAKDN